jgi:hypothetical protein
MEEARLISLPGQSKSLLDESFSESGSNGLRISGWALRRSSRRPLAYLVAAVDGSIEGFALGGLRRSDSLLHSKQAIRTGWVGYVHTPRLHGRLDVYGVVDVKQGELCPVGSAMLPER